MRRLLDRLKHRCWMRRYRKNVLFIKTGEGGYVGPGSGAWLNGHQLAGVRGIKFNLMPGQFNDVELTIRIDEIALTDPLISKIYFEIEKESDHA